MGLEQAFAAEREKIIENLDRQKAALESLRGPILQAGRAIHGCIASGGKVLFFGNGGSAADAQHWAAELAGRYAKERPGMAACALTTDTSALTAIANDYGFERVFERQVEALARRGDVAVGISTSGRSPNVLAGIRRAKELGCSAVAVLGKDGGEAAALADVAIVYGAVETPRIQEFHAVIGHLLCALAEAEAG
jgi:D-sedoheptulose 7-phosphate isomerase